MCVYTHNCFLFTYLWKCTKGTVLKQCNVDDDLNSISTDNAAYADRNDTLALSYTFSYTFPSSFLVSPL